MSNEKAQAISFKSKGYKPKHIKLEIRLNIKNRNLSLYFNKYLGKAFYQ